MKIETISKRQHLINTAAELFKEKGYAASSMRDLASRLGLEVSSIYSHIKSKEDILGEICMSCATRFSDGMKDIYFSESSSKKKMRALISLHLDIAYEEPASATVFNDEWKFLNETIKEEFLVLRREYEKKFKKILLDGKKEKKFEFKNVDVVFSIIIRLLSISYIIVNKHSREDIEAELESFITKALNKKTSKL